MHLGVAALILTGASTSARTEATWLDASRYGLVEVVLSRSATEPERNAASEFVKYWRLTTGHTPSICETPCSQVTVFIGRGSLPEELQSGITLDGLGSEGFHLRTYPLSTGRPEALAVVGGGPRGTLYAVYEFFERFMGVRWLTPDVTHVPPAPEHLPVIRMTYVPPLAWRDVNYRSFCADPDFALVHRLNGQAAAIPAEKGGNVGFANGFAHTFFSFVDPAEYGDAHPEYFSEIDGRRVTDPKGTQLCLTNEDVFRNVVEKVRGILRKAPSSKPIVCITQMDQPFWCECDQCRAVDAYEGSHSGAVIHFVNRVAEAIQGEFPHALVDTFAYTYTRKPPRHIKPRDNVIVRLCSIECDFSKPLSDPRSKANREFQKDLKGWARITKHLYVWDYTQNWYCFQGPHPNFHVLQPNIEFFVKHGVSGVFEQASPVSPHSDYEHLKGYLIARALWNPTVDWRHLYDEFLELYYREAAPFIREYHELITSKVRSDGYVLGIFSPMEWMDYDTVVQAEEIFHRAFASAQDESTKERLKYAYLPVQYSALVCPPKVEFTGRAYILTRPPSQKFDEYWSMLMAYGVTHLQDTAISGFKERLGGRTPPRRLEASLYRLQNERYEVWVAPALAGAVLRWRDRRTGRELLDGYHTFPQGRGLIHEWNSAAEPQPYPYYPYAETYVVTSVDSEGMVLQAGGFDGLTLTRRLRLAPGSPSLEYEMAVINPSASPVRPTVTLHAEFRLNRQSSGQMMVERDGKWHAQRLKPLLEGKLWADRLAIDGLTRWAFFEPGQRNALVCTWNASEMQSLYYVVNPEYRHVVLELEPSREVVEAGEARRIRTSFSVVPVERLKAESRQSTVSEH